MSQTPYQGELSSLRRRAARSVWDRLANKPPEPEPPPKALNGHKPVNGYNNVNGHHPPPEIAMQFALLPDAPPQPKTRPKRKPPTRLASPYLKQTEDAISAYNDILTRPRGVLPVVTPVGIENRCAEVERSIVVAQRMCMQLFGDPTVTLEFWQQYFSEVAKDEFKSGRMMGGNGHANWKPGFEYLTRPKTMVEVFEKAVSHAR